MIGAHTLGFNIDTVGVAALGSFDRAPASRALVHGLGRIIGWKLALHGRDPHGSTTVTRGSDPVTQLNPLRRGVRVRVVSGHRDVRQTACPGAYLYHRLPSVRDAAARGQGVLGLRAPVEVSGRTTRPTAPAR